ncbi:hypothetical protein pb186bvf_007252 [Paramecium bursaria]
MNKSFQFKFKFLKGKKFYKLRMKQNSKQFILQYPGQPIFMFEDDLMIVDEKQYQLSSMLINFDQNTLKIYDLNVCFHIQGDWYVLDSLFEILKKLCFQSHIKKYYDIIKMIGQGSFGKVYQGIHKIKLKMYAIKELQKKASQSKQVLQLEIDILRRLNHETCIHIHEQYLEDKYIYLVLDYISGGDLIDFLDQQPQLVDENTVRDIMSTLFEALEYIHSKGIVHRDLKPENILMRNKCCLDLVISDFGLADLCTNGFLTQRCGTLGFMAPELLRGKPYDYKVDVFSLGVILFGIFVGEYPFEGKDPKELQQKNWDGKINYDRQELKLISSQGLEFLTKCLSIDPKDRFSAKEAIKNPWLSYKDIDSRFLIDSQQTNRKDLKSSQGTKQRRTIIETQAFVDQLQLLEQEGQLETSPCQIMDQYIMKVHFMNDDQ